MEGLKGCVVGGRKLEDGGKLTVFLVNSVVLVEQHYNTIRRHTDFEVGRFSGDMNVDMWTESYWIMQLNSYRIIVLTAQIFLDIVRHGYLGECANEGDVD